VIQVVLLPTNHAPRFFPLVREWVRQSTRHSCGRYRVADVEQLITEGVFLLWLVWETESGEVKGMLVTSQGLYPRLRTLRVDFVAGVEFATWKDAAEDILVRFARDSGMVRLETVARRGWTKKLPHWTQSFAFLERAV
jgi:hypothetical protein